MTRFLIIDPSSEARGCVESALDGLGYELDWRDRISEWDLDPANLPDMIMLSADSLGGALSTFMDSYRQLLRPLPVLLWSRELPRERLIATMPPEVLLVGVFEGVPLTAELLLFVTERFRPSAGGVAVQRLLRHLGRRRAPLRSSTSEGRHDLNDFSLSRAMVTLASDGWSGGIHVEPLRGARIDIWFDRGGITMVNDGTTGAMLREARRRGLDQGRSHPEKPFPSVRDELDFLRRSCGLSTGDRARLAEWFAGEILARACAAREGLATVSADEKPEMGYGFSIDIRNALLAAARSLPQDVMERIPVQDSWYVLPSLPQGEEGSGWRLEGPDLFLRDYLEANLATRITVGAVKDGMVTSGANPEQVMAQLARLSQMGYLRFVGAPFSESTMDDLREFAQKALKAGRSDHFELLGVARNASKKIVDAAVLDASRKWHPDALVSCHPRVQLLGARLFAAVREAAEIIGDSARREAYIEDLDDGHIGRGGQDPERARVLLARGRMAMKSKRYAEASADLEAAAVADPSLVGASVLAIWAAWLADPGTAVRQIRAFEELGARSDAPAELWHFLGRIYLHIGNEDRGRQSFERALKIDPDHTDTQRQLRLLERRRGGEGTREKKGFWSRFRGG